MSGRQCASLFGFPAALALLFGIALIDSAGAFSQQTAPSPKPTNSAQAGSRQQASPETSKTGPGVSQEPESSRSDRVGSAGDLTAQQKTVTPPPRVIDAYNFEYPDAKDPNHSTAAIDDIVVLKVSSLRAIANQAACIDDQGNRLPNCQEQEIMLFLERRRFPGNTVEALDVNIDEIQFHLRRTPENDELWSDLLGDPPLDHRFFERPTAISIGLSNDSPVPSDVKDFKLVRISRGWFWAASAGAIVMLITVIQLAMKSDILRDAGPAPTDNGGRPLPKAYSLSRFQMAFWFVLVISSYVFIWLITDATDTLNTSVLALIGIGSGTALGSFAVDAGKTRAAASEGFLRDVLSDATGICFYRFQMFVWTLILGMIFLSSVWYSLSMPEFSATLLALQGISAGTYLGFKIPEKPATGADNTVPVQPSEDGDSKSEKPQES
jgi:hypothetical protein